MNSPDLQPDNASATLSDAGQSTAQHPDSGSINVNSIEESLNNRGIRAMLEKALQRYEHLPLRDVIFNRLIRILPATLRNFTSESVDVNLHSVSSIHFDDYINTLPLPTMIAVFKAVEWDKFALLVPDPRLIYSLVEVLLGGKKTDKPIKIESRPYTEIEHNIISQLTDIVLVDLATAFSAVTSITFQTQRTESNPLFVNIARPSDPVIVLQMRVEMEQRGGKIDMIFPYSMFESLKNIHMLATTEDPFGQNTNWSNILQQEVVKIPLTLEAVLKPKQAAIHDITKLKVGSTIIMDNSPEDDIILRCSNSKLFSGKLGKVRDKIAVHINQVFDPKARSK